MRAFHGAALIATVFGLGIFANACRKHIPPPAQIVVVEEAWTIPWMADSAAPFCVEVIPAPFIEPGDAGRRCVTVLDVRRWMAGIRKAH